jgi:hypothetical protein
LWQRWAARNTISAHRPLPQINILQTKLFTTPYSKPSLGMATIMPLTASAKS